MSTKESDTINKSSPIPKGWMEYIKTWLNRIYKNRWLQSILFLILIGIIWQLRVELRGVAEFALDQDAFASYIRNLGYVGPIVFWVLNATQIIIAVLPGHAIALGAGYIYGTYFGFIILYTSTIVAGQIAFLLSRRYGRPFVVRFVPEKILSRWDATSEKHGFTYFLIALLIPVFPTDVLTYIAGLSKISLPKFTLANILGRAPYIFLISMVGALGIEFVSQGLSSTQWIMMVLSLVVIFLAYKYMLPIITKEIFNREK